MAIVSKGGGGGGGGSGPQAAAQDERPKTNLPPKTAPVCGRKAEMHAVAERFNHAQNGGRPGVVELVGPPGVGVTTVALELARRVGGRFPAGAWYLPLSMGRDVAWADVGASMGRTRTTDLRSAADATRTALAEGPRALLVLDGALSREDLESSLPPEGSESVDVFVVSEEPSGLVEDVVHVSPVPEHAPRRIAHSVFRMRDGEETDPPAVRCLDGLGLTASLAARAAVAYDSRQGPLTVADDKAAVMRLVPLMAQNPISVEILLLCSVAHPVRIPVDALFLGVQQIRQGRGEAPEAEALGNGVLWLARLGLLMPDDEHRVSMHPMIQATARGMAQTDEDLAVARSALAWGLMEEAKAALGEPGSDEEGVDVHRAGLHQLRTVVPQLTGEAREVAGATLAELESALGARPETPAAPVGGREKS